MNFVNAQVAKIKAKFKSVTDQISKSIKVRDFVIAKNRIV